jgi:hypothetical protein
MPRYAISRHRGSPDGDHFDFFLEDGDTLKTWRILSPDLSREQAAVQIFEHRASYLDYSGPVSKGRGEVAVARSGTCEAVWSEREVRITLDGCQNLSLRLMSPSPGERSEWILIPHEGPAIRGTEPC